MTPKTSPQSDNPGLAEEEQDFDLTPEQLAELNRRQRENKDPGFGCDGDEVAAWIKSWGTPNELPPPKPRKIF
ncbi:MAG: hypothetical protein SFV19_03110 [Rhodospirillaceae bacterium]|nr:hypothetical protein [Rhodospirillaceae bacterium]